MNKVKYLVVHCSASGWGNAAEINKWHKSRGWSGIGYHWVILNGCPDYSSYAKHKPKAQFDGKIEPGRSEKKIGAHCPAVNNCSIAVCLIGIPPGVVKYTTKQMDALVHWCVVKCKQYGVPVSNIKQHSNFDSGKPYCASVDLEHLRDRVSNAILALSDDELETINPEEALTEFIETDVE